MNSATPRPFMDPSALNAAVIATHAPGRFGRLLFGFANWYLGLLSRTRLGMRMLRSLELTDRGQPDLTPGLRQREHHFHRTLRPGRDTPRRGSWQAGKIGHVHGIRPQDFPLPGRATAIGGQSVMHGSTFARR